MAGGTHLVFQADMTGVDPKDRSSALESAKNNIERRVNFFGVTEPTIQTSKQNDDYRLVVELPGVSEGEIQVESKDDILTLTTTGERKYAKEVLLPSRVDSATLKKSYKNAILEVRFTKAHPTEK